MSAVPDGCTKCLSLADVSLSTFGTVVVKRNFLELETRSTSPRSLYEYDNIVRPPSDLSTMDDMYDDDSDWEPYDDIAGLTYGKDGYETEDDDLTAVPSFSPMSSCEGVSSFGSVSDVSNFGGLLDTRTPKAQPHICSEASEVAALDECSESQSFTVPVEDRTTVMLRNIPNNFSRHMLVDLVESEGFAGQYDYIHLPADFKSRANLGYAFVNLTSPTAAQHFMKTFIGFSNWPTSSRNVCTVSWSSPHKGLQAHLNRCRKKSPVHARLANVF